MSWQENSKSNVVITTADGRVFSMLWLNPYRSQEYNVAEFEFPNLEGTLVKRGKAKGQRIELELYFQGEDHLEQSEVFRLSSAIEGNWQMNHPYYGLLTVVPLGLRLDNTKYNTTMVVLTVVETITQNSPRLNIDPKDKITWDKESSDALFAQSFANDVKAPSVSDLNQLTANNATVYKEGAKKVKLTINAQEYFDRFNVANSAILNATADPLNAIITLQAVVSYPALFAQSVEQRINLLVDQFTKLRTMVVGSVTYAYKKIYENNAGVLISTMSKAASTPVDDDDYGTREDVIRIINRLSTVMDQYMLDLDSLQSPNGGAPDSFIPDYNAINSLTAIVDYTISNLFNIALNSKQERRVLIADDSNAILLTHRFYGLDEVDANLEKFIRNNNIGINELITIRKGREVIYYV